MTIKYKQISENRYRKLTEMDHGRAYGCMINEAPMTIRGHRIRDCVPFENDGKYYIKYVTSE